MEHAKPLPPLLAQRYQEWQKTTVPANKDLYQDLAENGQFPHTMVVSCCDSRVQATNVFGTNAGEFFMHRNVANIVPPYAIGAENHGTSAALEYAVNSLKVKSVLVMGHSLCGGVQGCHAMCSGKAPQLEEETSFVGRWVNILRPAYDRVVATVSDEGDQVRALEKEGVLMSLENLMTFPFVKEKVQAGNLALHGAWINIADGTVEQYDPAVDSFKPV